MCQTMPDHLVLLFEPSATFATGTAIHRTLLGPRLCMDVGVGVKDIFSLNLLDSASLKTPSLKTASILGNVCRDSQSCSSI